MTSSAILWLICNLISIIVLAFYSMIEMACVSFNKVRLQYYVSKGVKQAIWLNFLLQNPTRLFGTTLIGVNIALVVGSECAREFYSAINLSPDLAPLTQVIIVIIFGELAPMFAARHYAENVAMIGVPLVYASAKLMAPLIWIVGLVSKLCNLVIGGKENEANIYLNQEELQKIIEEHGEDSLSENESAEISAVAANIFSLRSKDLTQIMEPLVKTLLLPSNAIIEQMEVLVRDKRVDCVPLYHQEITNIIGIAYPRDVLRATKNRRIRDYAHPPWFVSENTNIMQVLRQFRSNNEEVAIILNHNGKAVGLVNLNDLLGEIFGKMSESEQGLLKSQPKLMLIEKTFPGSTTVAEFYSQFGILLNQDTSLTLSDLIISHFGHRPEKGESIYIDPFEFKVKDISLLEIKTLTVSTKR